MGSAQEVAHPSHARRLNGGLSRGPLRHWSTPELAPSNIERPLQGAAVGEFVVALYNPRSRTRTAHLPRVLEILGAHRSPETPVAVVQQACRPRQNVIMSTLAEFQPEWVDMNSLVVVGSSTTRFVTSGGGRRLIVTPRDYQWMPDAVGEVDT